MRLLAIIFTLISVSLCAQTITRVEYYIDTDPGFGNGTPVSFTSGTDVTQDFIIPLTGVTEGFHIVYFRVKTNEGLWSLPTAQPVFVQQTEPLSVLTHIEYYIDTDPGFGNGTPVSFTSGTDVTQDFIIPLTGVTEGFHIVYFRAKDSKGKWTLPTAKPVFVQYANLPALTRMEYFIDTDPGFGNGTPVSVSGTDTEQAVTIDLTAVSPGFHILYTRVQNAHGHWSHPVAKPFVSQHANSNIVMVEYFFSDGTTQTPVQVYGAFTPGQDLTIDLSVILNSLLPDTPYTLYVTVINADGQRSQPVAHNFVTPSVICDPITPPSANGVSVCANTSATLTASGATGSQTYNWYDVPTGGTALETTSTFTTPVLSATTTYYVSIQNGTCESNRTAVTVTPVFCGAPPVINAEPQVTTIGQQMIVSLISFLSDADGDLDLSTLRIVIPPQSGALAFIDANHQLIVDYSNVSFSGTDLLTIEVCDLAGNCTQAQLIIQVEGDIIVYNGVSANNDGKNDVLLIQHIDVLPETSANRVTIYNRWGDVVWEGSNYNNTTVVFRGLNKNGNALPSGTYFYKIEFASGRKGKTGYLSLKR